MTRSPRLERLRWIGGWIAVAATLALLSPGVSLSANAEAGFASTDSFYGDGLSCQAGPGPEQQAVQLEQMIEVLRAQLANQAGEPGEEAIVLNNRGFNYGPAKAPGNGLVDLEARLP